MGSVLLDGGAFSLNTSIARIYTAKNLTLSPGPAAGTSGFVEVVQPRGAAYLDVHSWDASTASGAEINLKSSGPRRKGAGDYTVAVTEDGAFTITVGRPVPSELAHFEAVKPAVVMADEFIRSFNMSVNDTTYVCASAQWWGWAEAIALNNTWLLLNDSTFIGGILDRANATQLDVAAMANATGNWSSTNSSNGTLIKTNATGPVRMLDTFFYSFVNESFLCLEVLNKTTSSAGDAVNRWAHTNPPMQVAFALFQLYYSANHSIPQLITHGEALSRRRRRRMQQQAREAEAQQLFQFGELAAAIGALNTSSWGGQWHRIYPGCVL
eukprot:SAG25_NODE_406_length_8436_cov_11.691976_5_plen_325_part_00